MEINVREIQGKNELRKFIYLPAKIHADHKNWVPPIYWDEWIYFNPKKNKAFNYSSSILLHAYRGNQIVGRIMGIINHKYNKFRNEKTARFGCLETREEK